jgi:hypothetical protein
MTRLSLLPDSQFIQTVSMISKTTEELKERQFTGSNNLVIHHTKSANTWDLNELVLGIRSYVKWRATFTPDNVNRPFSQFQFEHDADPGSTDNIFTSYVDPLNIDSSAVSYIVEMLNFNISNANVRLKFAFKSLDTGALSFVRVEEF